MAGQVSRFRVVSGDDPSALTVTYLNGTNNFMVGETEEVYIYPQNEETASKEYVDSNFLPLTGGSLTGQLNSDSLIKSTRNTGYAFQVRPDNGDSVSWLHTNGTFHFGGKGTIHGDLDIESQSDSGVRILGALKVKQTGNAINQSNCFEVFGDRANYYGSTSSDDNIATVAFVNSNVADAVDGLATEQYVDDAVAAGGGGGGVPVGSIMIWMNSSVPDGWFKLQGSNFDTSKYPLLHAYLQKTSGYTSGKLPNWGGYYPGEYGDHLTHDLGSKQGYKTAMPSAGAPRTSNSIPNGNTRGFNGAGGTNAYSDGKAKATIDENWDSTTRPKTVVVHYIIKHD